MPALLSLLSRKFSQEALIGLAETAVFMILRYEFMKWYKAQRNKNVYPNTLYYGAIQ